MSQNPIRVSYRTRWGHERARVLKGHPKREARRRRAAERAKARVES